MKSPSLYELIGLEDYAPTTEVEKQWRSVTQGSQAGSIPLDDLRLLAFEQLRDPHTKQLYDTVLESLLRNDLILPRICDEEIRSQIRLLVGSLGYAVEQIAPETFQIVSYQHSTTTESTRSSELKTVAIGTADFTFSIVPFIAELGWIDDDIRVRLADCPAYSFLLESAMSEVDLQHDNQGLIVKIGPTDNSFQLNAAYINQSTGVYGPLSSASDRLFPKNSLHIAHRFGVRNTPPRIKGVILNYYKALAMAVAMADPRIDPNACSTAMVRLAKKYHPQFAF